MKWNGLKCLETAGIGDDKDNDNDGDDEASNELAGLMTVLTLSFFKFVCPIMVYGIFIMQRILGGM